MSEISDKLKQQYQDDVAGKGESAEVEGIGRVFWKPLNGQTQKTIQAMAEKSTAEGMCMHVKLRAIDDKGALIFKDNTVLDMMTDMDFEVISNVFFAITALDLSMDELEKN